MNFHKKGKLPFSKTSEASRQKKWSFEENKLLLNVYNNKRNHWKEISKEIPHRNDNSIKNQFFALVRKGLRKAYKSIGLTDNTNKVNTIKPKILLDFFDRTLIYSHNNSFEHLKMSSIIEEFALSDHQKNLTDNAQMKAIIEFLIAELNSMKYFHQQPIH